MWIKMHLLKNKAHKMPTIPVYVCIFIWLSSQKNADLAKFLVLSLFLLLDFNEQNGKTWQKGKEGTNLLIECHYNWVVWMDIS